MKPSGKPAVSQISKPLSASAASARKPKSDAKVPLVDRAYHEIKRRIIDNDYPAGHHVLERELVADLGMSRTPVREALVRLQNENMVQIIPRHGMRVIPLSLEDLQEVHEVVTALELVAVERLINRNCSDEELSGLTDALEEMDLAVREGDADAWVQADERFHHRLILLAGNSRLASIAIALWDQGHRARTTTVRLRDTLEVSNREHGELVQAIKDGDWERASACHRAHRKRASKDILQLLDRARLARI